MEKNYETLLIRSRYLFDAQRGISYNIVQFVKHNLN